MSILGPIGNNPGRRSALAVSAFASIGHTFTHLLTAFYFVIVLAIEKEWGRSYAELIQLWTVGSFLMGLGALPAGWLSDRWNAGGMMVVLFLGMGGSSILCGFADTSAMLWLGLTGIGLFASIYHPVGIAWLVGNARRQGRALGINGIFGSIGVASAGLVAGALTDLFGWRSAFILPGAISIALGFALLACLRLGVIADAPAMRRSHDEAEANGGDMLRGFLILTVGMICGGLIWQSTQTALPKFFEERVAGFAGDGVFGIGALVAIVYGVSGFMQVVGGHLADRYPLKPVYILLYAVQIPLLALAAGAAGLPLILVATLMATFSGASLPAENMLLSRFSPQKHRSLAFGVKYVISFGLAPLALLLVSFVYERTGGFGALFMAMAALAAVVTVTGMLLPGLSSQKRPQTVAAE
jgi:MFS transporter, FSR family, fosmidomycin resistance protein